MQNKDILKISVIFSLLGILLLLILSNILEPKLTKIKDIYSIQSYKKIKIQGKVNEIKSYEKFKIIKLSDDTDSINVIINSDFLKINPNCSVKVIGTIIEYNKETEVKADRISILPD